MRIDAVGLFAKNMEVLVSFYRDVIGMKTDWKGEPYAEFQMDAGSRFIMFGRTDFETIAAQKFSYPHGVNGTMEIAFDFPDYSDVDKEFERLVKAGAKPVMQPTTEAWGQRTSYVSDPEGNLIEISSFGKKE